MKDMDNAFKPAWPWHQLYGQHLQKAPNTVSFNALESQEKEHTKKKRKNPVMESYTIKWLTGNMLQDIFYTPCCPQINWITSYHPQKSLKAPKPNIGNFKPQDWDTAYFDVELDIDTDVWNFN